MVHEGEEVWLQSRNIWGLLVMGVWTFSPKALEGFKQGSNNT